MSADSSRDRIWVEEGRTMRQGRCTRDKREGGAAGKGQRTLTMNSTICCVSESISARNVF